MSKRSIFRVPSGRQTERPVITRKWLYVSAVVWVTLVGIGACIAWFYPPAPHFACVEPGVLYRSGQMGEEALRVLHERYAIRTVINLRSPGKLETDSLAQEEITFAREEEIRFINLPYGDPSPEVQVEKFLALVADPANRPVLVHCAAGEERSGVMAAAYRIRVQGWTFARALVEMESFGFDPVKEADMVRLVRRIADDERGGRSLEPE